MPVVGGGAASRSRTAAGMIELVGGVKTERDLGEMSARLADPDAVMRRQATVLEASEVGTFAELGGRYVKTGATMRSLTLPEAPGAIRRVVAGALEFGTDVSYARYLTEHIGPPTESGGMKRPKPVAVLKLTPATSQRVARNVMDQIVGEGGSAGLGSSFIAGML